VTLKRPAHEVADEVALVGGPLVAGLGQVREAGNPPGHRGRCGLVASQRVGQFAENLEVRFIGFEQREKLRFAQREITRGFDRLATDVRIVVVCQHREGFGVQ
jgi:hypothetical protein